MRLENLLGSRAEEVVESLRSAVLPKSAQEMKLELAGVTKPYNDPKMRNRSFRSTLVKALLVRDMVDISLDPGEAFVGLFGVWKSDRKKVRLIIDARISNTFFSDPENPRLPTGAAFSRFQVGEGKDCT